MRSFLALALLLTSTSAWSAELSDYGEPAVIELVAPAAVVENSGGKVILTLKDVDSLATVAAAMHKRDKRIFDAFPVSELPAAWNSCNAMKAENKLFHSDGVNSLVAFDDGPGGQPRTPHLAKAPLVTAPKDTTRISGADEGIARLMLINAAMVNGDLQFDIQGGAIEPGNYEHVRVLAECIIT